MFLYKYGNEQDDLLLHSLLPSTHSSFSVFRTVSHCSFSFAFVIADVCLSCWCLVFFACVCIKIVLGIIILFPKTDWTVLSHPNSTCFVFSRFAEELPSLTIWALYVASCAKLHKNCSSIMRAPLESTGSHGARLYSSRGATRRRSHSNRMICAAFEADPEAEMWIACLLISRFVL